MLILKEGLVFFGLFLYQFGFIKTKKKQFGLFWFFESNNEWRHEGRHRGKEDGNDTAVVHAPAQAFQQCQRGNAGPFRQGRRQKTSDYFWIGFSRLFATS